MIAKPLTIMLSPDTRSWLIRKAASLGAFGDAYAAELIEQARARDEMSGGEIRHRDGDPRNLDPAGLELKGRASDEQAPGIPLHHPRR